MARIMYIEDDERIRFAGKMLLRNKKNTVIALENADSAIAIASIWKPDLIISDHDLGTEYTGLQFAQEVKTNGFNVAMMTGADIRDKARELGIPCFMKPCLITDVVNELMEA